MELIPFDFNPLTTHVDPFPLYAAMRETGRFLQAPIGVVLVHRYEDVRRVHADHERLSMSAISQFMTSADSNDPDPALVSQMMLTADPPDHTRLRSVVNRAFTPRAIASLEDSIRIIARRMLEPLATNEPFELVSQLAGPLPTTVIAELLGVPSKDAKQFRAWSEAMTGTLADDVDPVAAAQANTELHRYLLDQIALRHHEPSEDLIGRLIAANNDGSMTDDEVAAACVLLLLAGNETTMRLITNLALALGRFPEQQALLVGDRALIPSAVEETLRYDSPIQLMSRAAKEPVSIDGVEFDTGTILMTLLGAANRDPEAFTEPDEFDLTRPAQGHVAFGHGIHFCLGAQLARLEARVVLEELLDVCGRLKVVTRDDQLVYPATAMLRSPRSLVVEAA